MRRIIAELGIVMELGVGETKEEAEKRFYDGLRDGLLLDKNMDYYVYDMVIEDENGNQEEVS